MKISALIRAFKEIFQSNPSRTDANPIADHQREILVKQGRDQFKALLDRGLNVPVALL